VKSKTTELTIYITILLLISSCVSYKEIQANLNPKEKYDFEISKRITSKCNWGYKSTYFNKSATQEADIVVIISRQGELLHYYFTKNADDPAFNQMIEEGIIKSEPFPAFPESFVEETYLYRSRISMKGKPLHKW
jgi:TonB C terminal